MSATEIEQIKKILQDHYDERVAVHDEFKQSLDEIQRKLDPVYNIYSQFSGFGKISIGFFKWVVIPVSVVLGIAISVIKLWKGKW